jgi:hypothetical protein
MDSDQIPYTNFIDELFDRSQKHRTEGIDYSQVPSVIFLTAYIGRGPEAKGFDGSGRKIPETVTLFADRELRESAVVFAKDILYAEKSDPESDCGLMRVWLHSEARTIEQKSKSVRAWTQAAIDQSQAPPLPQYVVPYPYGYGGVQENPALMSSSPTRTVLPKSHC